MLYLWFRSECPDKHHADYNRQVSPDYLLLMQGIRLQPEEFSRCDCYLRSTTLDLTDDPFIRNQLRLRSHTAYIFTPNELFYFDGFFGNKIVISLERMNTLKKALSLSDDTINKAPKTLSDEDLKIIYTFEECPPFSRVPILSIRASKDVIKKRYDCIPCICSAPIVNQKIVDILLQLAPGDVQFFNTEIICNDGILTDYKLLNFTSKIKGIDHSKSVYTTFESGGISGIKSLTYKPDCMGTHNLARDADYIGHKLATEAIKQAFIKAKITGVTFYRPEWVY